ALVQQYLERTLTEAAAIAQKAAEFRKSYDALLTALAPFLPPPRGSRRQEALTEEKAVPPSSGAGGVHDIPGLSTVANSQQPKLRRGDLSITPAPPVKHISLSSDGGEGRGEEAGLSQPPLSLSDLSTELDAAAKSCFAALDEWAARIARDWKKSCAPNLP